MRNKPTWPLVSISSILVHETKNFLVSIQAKDEKSAIVRTLATWPERSIIEESECEHYDAPLKELRGLRLDEIQGEDEFIAHPARGRDGFVFRQCGDHYHNLSDGNKTITENDIRGHDLSVGSIDIKTSQQAKELVKDALSAVGDEPRKLTPEEMVKVAHATSDFCSTLRAAVPNMQDSDASMVASVVLASVMNDLFQNDEKYVRQALVCTTVENVLKNLDSSDEYKGLFDSFVMGLSSRHLGKILDL